jgi:hypothetical protein
MAAVQNRKRTTKTTPGRRPRRFDRGDSSSEIAVVSNCVAVSAWEGLEKDDDTFATPKPCTGDSADE